ncbi:MAG TPA: glycoside hydrolase family 3 C-terminal domain-containing protein, partial [Pseudonocardiaceae bacterium]
RPPHRWVPLHLPAGDLVRLVARRPRGEGTGRAAVLAADPPRPDPAAEFDAAVRLAEQADVAVVVVGTTDDVESEGFDRTDLRLPGDQDALVRAVAAVNPRTVAVVNSGGPVALPWRHEVAAVLLTWFPGQETGHGLADVIFGDREPGGRLPTTWADEPLVGTTPAGGVLRYDEGLHLGHRGYLRAGVEPSYWFGHGLGYTTWSYESLEVDGLRARVRLRNTGDRAGRELVQLYLSRPDSAVERPARWLAAFTHVDAGPGETVHADLDIPPTALRHWSTTHHRWETEPGEFTVLIGRSAGESILEGVV